MESTDAEDPSKISKEKMKNTNEHDATVLDIARKNESFHSFRYIIMILGGLALGAMYFTRLSISVAMISMVNHTHLYLAERPFERSDEFFESDYVEVGEFNWSNEIQQIINSGYMIFYTLPQIFTTKLALKYGIRGSICLSLLICSLSCLLTPIVAYWGWGWVLMLRCLNGAGASAILPSMIGSIENWLTYNDSAFGLSIMQFVATLMQMTTPLICGHLASIHWKWAFYVPALASSTFAIIWWIVVRNTPESCPFLSQQELNRIKCSTVVDGSKKVPEKRHKRTDLPWHFMFKIKTFYGFVTIWVLYCMTAGSLNFLLPTYFNKVLKISVKDNGFYNSLTQLGVVFSMLWPNPTVKFLQTHFDISLTRARRIVVFIYTSVYICTLSYIAAYHENQVFALIINRLFHNTNDTVITSTLMSQYGLEGVSGMVFSVMNSIGNFSTVIFCWNAGKFLDFTGESLTCWSWIFIIQSLMNLFLLLIYTAFLRSEPISIPKRKCEENGTTMNESGGDMISTRK